MCNKHPVASELNLPLLADEKANLSYVAGRSLGCVYFISNISNSVADVIVCPEWCYYMSRWRRRREELWSIVHCCFTEGKEAIGRHLQVHNQKMLHSLASPVNANLQRLWTGYHVQMEIHLEYV